MEEQEQTIAELKLQLKERTITRVEILGHPDEPVAAPCCIDGCQYSSLSAIHQEMEQLIQQWQERGTREHDEGKRSVYWHCANRLSALLRSGK